MILAWRVFSCSLNNLKACTLLIAPIGKLIQMRPNRQQELTNLDTKLQTDAENVQKAALICFSDLEACVSNTNQVLANVVAYDRKIVEVNLFTDGLVAYYPFNSQGGLLFGREQDFYNRALNDSEIEQLYNNASNQTKNCKAKLLDQKLEVPCVRVPNVIVGGADIYSLEMINTPFSKRFDVDLNTLKKHTFQDSCLAKYSFKTGGLNLPCVNVPNDRDYVMKMQQRTGTLIFDLIDTK